ncbi:MAG: hypothetical protein HFH91_04965 [Lachnospiraceae bacterium]|nr:hypothetical protein [Lachnospiraceae bacterium]
MNAVWKTFLSMSFSGGLLILALLLGKRFLKDRISRQWQYYIWLAAVARLLLPFGPEVSLLGEAYQAVDHAITQVITQAASGNAAWEIIQDVLLQPQEPVSDAAGGGPAFTAGSERDSGEGWDNGNGNNLMEEKANSPAEGLRLSRDTGALLLNHVWLIWLVAAFGLLIRKATIYQSFVRYVHAGATPVFDMESLDRISLAAGQKGIKKPVELWVNPLISSPLLIGFFHPCIVLPRADIPERDFRYIILHELTHYRRRDMLYKWLVQLTVCLHWFNPLVHLMGREIDRACEFSCDEAVLMEMGSGSAEAYGETLLDAMAAVGRYRESPGAVTLGENKQLLKERLDAVMRFKVRSRAVKVLTAALTFGVVLGAAFIGVYTCGFAAGNAQAQAVGGPEEQPDTAAGLPDTAGMQPDTAAGQSERTHTHSSDAERYYEDGNLPLFQIVFSRMGEEEQEIWLDKIYEEDQIVFWGAAMGLLEEDCGLIRHYAEKTYEDGEIAWFATLAMHMSRETLEEWLDRALEDGRWNFQSALFDMLGRGDEFDELEEKQEKEWEAAQEAEYQAVGVTMDGKDYYYQGQLVNLFLDIRPGGSFYTLNLNPKGTVNIRIVRGEDGKISGVVYMTETEAAELFGELYGDGNVPEVELIPVALETVAAGEIVFLGEYTLSEGDEIRYDILAETGNGIEIFFAKDQERNTFYYAAHIMRQQGEPLKCTVDFIAGPPVPSGTYKLYLRGDGDLGDVKGSISIVWAGEAYGSKSQSFR